MLFSTRLDLKSAWMQVKSNFRDQVFVNFPYTEDLIDYSLDKWVKKLRDSLRTGAYNPSECRIVDIPKSDWHIRPGSVLTPEDMVIYYALVFDNIKAIYKRLKWSAKRYRFSTILLKKHSGSKWVEFPNDNWIKFKEKVKKELIKSKYVVVTDLAGYFENIDISRLMSDLEYLGAKRDSISLLTRCLNRWAEPRGRGIPQGYLPSNILSEVYLDSIDLRLVNENVNFVRFSDDRYIFCKSKEEAIKSLHMFTRILREKGLNIQTAKTKILSKKEATEEFEKAVKSVDKTNTKFRKEVRIKYGILWSYLSPAQVRTVFRKIGGNLKIKVLRKVFDTDIRGNQEKFNKSQFHFLLYRLKSLNDSYAVDFCLSTITKRPEETPSILEYLKSFKTSHSRKITSSISNILANDQSIMFDFQRFEIIEWLWKENVVSKSLVTSVRNNLNRPDLSIWTRNCILAYLGNHGNTGDFDTILADYSQSPDFYSKAAIVCSLRKLERSRRNSFYARVSGDGSMIKTSVEWSKSRTE